jgi:hypothetical protein
LIGSPDEVVDKILRHSEALGGISRFSFQMNVASLSQAKMMRAIVSSRVHLGRAAISLHWRRYYWSD